MTEEKGEPRPPGLAQVRARHPGWSIAFENGVYIAVERPAQTARNIVAFETLGELATRLDELDQR